MKEEINLLPFPVRHSRLIRLYVERLSLLVRTVGVVLLLLALMFGGMYGYLQYRQQELQSQLVEIQAIDPQTNEAITAANELVTILQPHVVHQPWVPQVATVLRALPADARLNSIVAQGAAGTMVLGGTFTQRAGIVALEHTLAALPWVEHVEAPLKNLATGTTRQFTVTLKRKEVRP